MADVSAAASLSSGSAIVLGVVSESTKAWLYRRARVYVSPSSEEGWGISVGDGLYGGSWVVSYDIPAVRRAYPVGPIYVPPGRSDEFIAATLHCLEQPRPGPLSDEAFPTWDVIARTDLHAILEGANRPARRT